MNRHAWSPEIVAFGERLAALTVAAAAELSDYLEAVHHVRAEVTAALLPRPEDVPVVVNTPPQTEWNVVLEGYDPAKKIAVIRTLREVTGLGLKEARDSLEATPKVVRAGLPREEADRLKTTLEAAGAKVAVR